MKYTTKVIFFGFLGIGLASLFMSSNIISLWDKLMKTPILISEKEKNAF